MIREIGYYEGLCADNTRDLCSLALALSQEIKTTSKMFVLQA